MKTIAVAKNTSTNPKSGNPATALARVASRFINTPLLVEPKKFEVILSAVKNRFGIAEVPGIDAAWDYDDDSADRKDYQVIDGIAVIPVTGTLMKKTYGLWAMSGCCSYEAIQDQIEDALEDGGVQGIILDIDSPGGETTGCFELADYIFAARAKKPIWAVANDLAASAAYAIASAASKIYVTRMGAVGSIGVYALHVSQAGFDKEAGIEYSYVFAGAKKVDGNPHAALSDSARSDIQSEVDREYDIFVATVARNRDVKNQAVADTEAGVFFAENSVPMLADEIGTFEDAAAAMLAMFDGQSGPGRMRASLPAAVLPSGSESFTAAEAAISLKGEAMKDDKLPLASAASKADDGTGDDGGDNGSTETKRGKKAVDSNPEDGEDDTENPEDPEIDDKEEAKKGKKAAALAGSAPLKAVRTVEDIEMISGLCQLANVPEQAAEYLKKNLSVAEVREILVNQRAAESEKHSVSNHHNPLKSSGGIQALEAEAAAFARQNKGTTKEQAFARMLEENPEIYAAYSDEHNTRGLRQQLGKIGLSMPAGR